MSTRQSVRSVPRVTSTSTTGSSSRAHVPLRRRQQGARALQQRTDAVRQRPAGGWGFFYRAGPWPAPHNVFFDVDAARSELEDGSLQRLEEAAGEVRPPFDFADEPDLPDGRPSTASGCRPRASGASGGNGTRIVRWLRIDGGAAELRCPQRAPDLRADGRRPDRPAGGPRRRERPRRLPAPLPAPRREGEGVLYVNGRGHDVRWSRPAAGRRHDLDLRRQRRSGHPPAGASLVGDRTGRQRHHRGLKRPSGSVVGRWTLVLALAGHRRQEGIHGAPDLVIGVERAAGARDAAANLLRVRVVDLIVPRGGL